MSIRRACRSALSRVAALVAVLAMLAVLALGAPGVERAEAAGPFQVVVNSANPVSSLSKADVAKLLLRKTTAWSSGDAVQPVDLPEDSDVRRTFSERVLGRPVSAVRAYWQERIFTGRGVPPVEKASDSEVLAYVAANRNAIGYVSGGASVGAGIKVIALQE